VLPVVDVVAVVSVLVAAVELALLRRPRPRRLPVPADVPVLVVAAMFELSCVVSAIPVLALPVVSGDVFAFVLRVPLRPRLLRRPPDMLVFDMLVFWVPPLF
jgi:hypothetical protein